MFKVTESVWKDDGKGICNGEKKSCNPQHGFRPFSTDATNTSTHAANTISTDATNATPTGARNATPTGARFAFH